MIKDEEKSVCKERQADKNAENSEAACSLGVKVGRKVASKGVSKREKEHQLAPLRDAAKKIADMLCEFSGERELFLSDGPIHRRLDTKALKEFSSVLKEIIAVVAELNGESADKSAGVRIEFSDEALDMGI